MHTAANPRRVVGRVVRRLRSAMFAWRHPQTKILNLNLSPSARQPPFSSQAGQDAYIIREFESVITAPGFPRVFVDIGANHPKNFSNSHEFERRWGFRTVAIDPLVHYEELWRTERPGAAYVACAVGKDDRTIAFRTPNESGSGDDMFSGAVTSSSKALRRAGNSFREIHVPQRHLEGILTEHGISEIGILGIDVEGAEMDVLSGIDFRKTRVEIILVENNASWFGDEAIRTHIQAAGFHFYARFWNLDDLFVSPAIWKSLRTNRKPAHAYANELLRARRLPSAGRELSIEQGGMGD